MWILDLKKE